MDVRFSNDIVEIAEQQLGCGEVDPSWMQRFMQPVGFVQGEEWCLRFARACWYWTYQRHDELLDELFAYQTGSAGGFLEDAEKAERVHTALSVGAVVIYVDRRQNLLGQIRLVGVHCGICVAVSVNQKTIMAIEGNTDETGRDNGHSVCRIERSVENCRFVF